MTDEEAKKFRRRALVAADRMGFNHEREDIASAVLVKLLEHKDRGATVDQLTIDVIRERTGRKGAPSYVKRQNLQSVNFLDPEEILGRIVGPDHGASLDARIDIGGLAHFLRGTERCIAFLHFLWGLNEKEIGYCFGVTESRISQRISSIQARLSNIIQQNDCPEKSREARDSAISDIETGWDLSIDSIDEADFFID